jgi:hypothetical protein
MDQRDSSSFAICKLNVPVPELRAEAGDYLLVQPDHEFPVVVVRYPDLSPQALTRLLSLAGGLCPTSGTMTRQELRECLLELLDDPPSAPGPGCPHPWPGPPVRA